MEGLIWIPITGTMLIILGGLACLIDWRNKFDLEENKNAKKEKG